MQAELLHLLAAGHTMTIDDLIDGVYGAYGEQPEDPRTVIKVMIYNLRKKLKPLGVTILTTVNYDLDVPTLRGGRRIGNYTLSKLIAGPAGR
jgi:hypothetical protein